jgi:hypothetical protein
MIDPPRVAHNRRGEKIRFTVLSSSVRRIFSILQGKEIRARVASGTNSPIRGSVFNGEARPRTVSLDGDLISPLCASFALTYSGPLLPHGVLLAD